MTADVGPDDAAFLEVKTPSRGDCAGSPEFAPDAKGFLIAAPRRVAAGERTRIPVCAGSRFGDERDGMPAELWDDVVLVVVDVTHNRFSAKCLADEWGSPATPDEEPEQGEESEEERATRRGIIREYFNFDAGEFVPLAPDDAVYYIFITRGSYQSNTVCVEAVKPPRPVR